MASSNQNQHDGNEIETQASSKAAEHEEEINQKVNNAPSDSEQAEIESLEQNIVAEQQQEVVHEVNNVTSGEEEAEVESVELESVTEQQQEERAEVNNVTSGEEQEERAEVNNVTSKEEEAEVESIELESVTEQQQEERAEVNNVTSEEEEAEVESVELESVTEQQQEERAGVNNVTSEEEEAEVESIELESVTEQQQEERAEVNNVTSEEEEAEVESVELESVTEQQQQQEEERAEANNAPSGEEQEERAEVNNVTSKEEEAVAVDKAKQEKEVEQPIRKTSNTEEFQAVKPLSSKEAEDYVLSVVQALDQNRINVDRLRITIDGETVFSMKDGNIDHAENQISDKQAEQLKTALKDPEAFQGKLTITRGQKVLLYIENGRVITDSLGLTKRDESSKVNLESASAVSKESYQRYSKDVKRQGLAGSEQIAKNALQDGMSRGEVAEMMKNYDNAFKNMANKSGEKVADAMIISKAELGLVQDHMVSEQKSQLVGVSKGRSV